MTANVFLSALKYRESKWTLRKFKFGLQGESSLQQIHHPLTTLYFIYGKANKSCNPSWDKRREKRRLGGTGEMADSVSKAITMQVWDSGFNPPAPTQKPDVVMHACHFKPQRQRQLLNERRCLKKIWWMAVKKWHSKLTSDRHTYTHT